MPSNDPEIVVADGDLTIEVGKDVKVEYKNIPWEKHPPTRIELWWVEDTDNLGAQKPNKRYFFYREIDEGSGNLEIKGENFNSAPGYDGGGIGKYWVIARDKNRKPIAVSEIFEIIEKPPDPTPSPTPSPTPVPYGELIYGDLFNNEYSELSENISEVGEEDGFWHFRASAGQKVIIQVAATGDGHRLDPEVVLVSPDETTHTAKHGHGGPDFVDIGTKDYPHDLTKTGKYKVIVKSEGAGQDTFIGPYNISLKILPYTAASFPLPQIEDGGVYYGELTSLGSTLATTMSWSFQGSKDQFLSLAVEPNDPNQTANFEPRVRLLYEGDMKKAGDPGKDVAGKKTKVIEDYSLELGGIFKVVIEKENSVQPGPYRYKLCMHLRNSRNTYKSSQCESLR